jgi:hypothetical protein
VSLEISARGALGALRPEHWIMGLDRWLRRRLGIYEYSTAERCLLRAERCRADAPAELADGVRVRVGDPLLRLHLWNERVPPMGRQGPSIGWARRIEQDLAVSLRELARHLAPEAGGDAVVAVCAQVHLASERQRRQVARIFGRFGFQMIPTGRTPVLRDLGESLLVALLVFATNPVSLRNGLLRRGTERVMISRAQLLRRYGTPARRTGRLIVHAGDRMRTAGQGRSASPAQSRASGGSRLTSTEKVSASRLL